LLFGEVVVAYSGAMQRAQRRLGGTKIAGVAIGLGDMERHAIDPAAHQRLASGKQQRRRDAELARSGERTALAPEQQDRQAAAPPRHLIETAQHRIDLVAICLKAAALDGRKHVALEHDAALPAPAKLRRFVASDHAHPSSTRTASLGSVRQGPANPGLQIRQRARAQSAFLGDIPWPQPAVGGGSCSPRRIVAERRQQAEIDVHRLK
jgi:hypothetical protein